MSTYRISPPAIEQARYQTGRIQDQAIQNQTVSGQAVDHTLDETSRPASANFSAKLDRKSIRVSVDAVVDVDTGTRLLLSGPSPTYSRACGSTGKQFECASMSQSPAIFDARSAVPVCWEVL